MPKWYDDEMDQLTEDLSSGAISAEEYHKATRELNWELREAADEEAERARDEYMGHW